MAEQKETILNETLTILDGTNFSYWKSNTRRELKRQGLWSLVEGTRLAPLRTQNDKTYETDLDSALALIAKSLDEQNFREIDDIDDPKEAWDKLMKVYDCGQSKPSTTNRQAILFSSIAEGGGSVTVGKSETNMSAETLKQLTNSNAIAFARQARGLGSTVAHQDEKQNIRDPVGKKRTASSGDKDDLPVEYDEADSSEGKARFKMENIIKPGEKIEPAYVEFETANYETDRGLLLILAYSKFEVMNQILPGSAKPLPFTVNDSHMVNHVFSKFNFTIDILNKDAQSGDKKSPHEATKLDTENFIEKHVNDIKANPDKYNCVIVYISSHGNNVSLHGTCSGHPAGGKVVHCPKCPSKSLVFCCDDEVMETNWVYQQFIECENLRDKPKLFFVDTCQGIKIDSGVEVKPPSKGKSPGKYIIPKNADHLVALASIEDYVSWGGEIGSRFTEALCAAIEQLAPKNTDLVTMLTLVNNEVAKKVGCKQMPNFKSTLRRFVRFESKDCDEMTK